MKVELYYFDAYVKSVTNVIYSTLLFGCTYPVTRSQHLVATSTSRASCFCEDPDDQFSTIA